MLIEHIKVNFNRKAKYKIQNSTYANNFLDNVQTLSNHIIGAKKKYNWTYQTTSYNATMTRKSESQ